MKSEITITWELRPCIVDGKKGLFHRWEDYAEVVGESALIGGHSAGQLSCCFGLVEFEDGNIQRVQPHNIRFVDNAIKEYAFAEDAECD